MAHDYAPIDINTNPSLIEIVEEIRRTNRPRILRRGDKDVAVISPVKKSAKGSTRFSSDELALPTTYTLETAFGAVATRHYPEDFDRMIREVKEERAERGRGHS